jgi:hypothetical protein
MDNHKEQIHTWLEHSTVVITLHLINLLRSNMKSVRGCEWLGLVLFCICSFDKMLCRFREYLFSSASPNLARALALALVMG